ncbi:histidine ammonia-lyase [Alteromonas sediminis]|uniref:Histidine ammonia-lyase n=1 Tax=Alteromonas sediminis TaxID=2259342 RepID=A0A3N5YQW3_9ALTE|nr:histidine ammonia-lyase [Alteromonas sediminis]RPJ68671.1 histidine ammonia-lyase [Alteromonas sediminis]
MSFYELHPGQVSLQDMRSFFHQHTPVKLSTDARKAIDKSAKTVSQVIEDDRVVYGINTGFGLLANTRIKPEELELLQRSIVLSHAAGIGRLMDDSVVRVIMLLKINSLSRGYSGIRLQVIDNLLALFNAQVYPCIPSKGSVGASGDLAPLSHLAMPLMGEGDVRYKGDIISAKDGLRIAGIEEIDFAPKEGLALLNGTQASTALALAGLFKAENLYLAASVAGAMSVEAARGSRTPFDARIHQVRGHQGQIDAAALYRHLLANDSEIGLSHSACDKVQDPYSLRCQPQVMGACLTQIRHAAEVLHVEANGVTDNPLVFGEDDEILSGGNFHAEPVAMAADNLAIAIAEIGALSERRIALLIDTNLSGLPPFLVDNGGVNSGFMLAQVTAAALASENKTLAHPASVDSLPTSANQEDHVSMATFAARRLSDMCENSTHIVAVELLAAAQGLDFSMPLTSSPAIEEARKIVREQVAFYAHDRYFSPDIKQAAQIIECGEFNSMLKGYLPSV